MADVTVTAANVRALTENGAVIAPGPLAAGAAVTIGYAVYIASDGDVEHADANVSAAATRAIGIAVAGAVPDTDAALAAGDPISVCVFGPVSGFSSLTPGANLYVSDTAGRIADAAGTFDRIIGYALNASTIFVFPQINDPSSA